MNSLNAIIGRWIAGLILSLMLVLVIKVGVGHYVFDFLQLAILRWRCPAHC
jgi:hypothetical protein